MCGVFFCFFFVRLHLLRIFVSYKRIRPYLLLINQIRHPGNSKGYASFSFFFFSFFYSCISVRLCHIILHIRAEQYSCTSTSLKIFFPPKHEKYCLRRVWSNTAKTANWPLQCLKSYMNHKLQGINTSSEWMQKCITHNKTNNVITQHFRDKHVRVGSKLLFAFSLTLTPDKSSQLPVKKEAIFLCFWFICCHICHQLFIKDRCIIWLSSSECVTFTVLHVCEGFCMWGLMRLKLLTLHTRAWGTSDR